MSIDFEDPVLTHRQHDTGYVTLFAAAFPLAAPLSLLCNMIELRSDAFKITYACRRPHSLAARDTGPWEGIVTCKFM